MRISKSIYLAALAVTVFGMPAHAEMDVKDATVGCAAGAAATSVILFPGIAYAYSAGAKEGRVVAGSIAATGCVLGGIHAATAAEADETPSETELKSDDLQTLQDARDLQSE